MTPQVVHPPDARTLHSTHRSRHHAIAHLTNVADQLARGSTSRIFGFLLGPLGYTASSSFCAGVEMGRTLHQHALHHAQQRHRLSDLMGRSLAPTQAPPSLNTNSS